MSSTSLRSSQVQQLFVGASWALAHGDAGGLAQVVSDLAQSFTGELQQELLELSRQCHVDYDTAAERWPGVCARAHAARGQTGSPSDPRHGTASTSRG